MFSPGDIVICIDGKNIWKREVCSSTPQEGNYYTIRNTDICPGSGNAIVRLNEITCKINPNTGGEYGFWAIRFRKAMSDHDERVLVETLGKEI